MLKTAPKFYEVAKRIIEITKDCIIVAHNASFDYRILRTEFRRLGYDFEASTLCTVELAQKLLPEQTSYSLGKLVRALGIPMADRHRASGDALATVKLFQMLLDKDLEKIIVKEHIKTEIIKGIAPRLLDIIESLPSKTGIYYIHREDGKIIYIGKSRNIRKRINQHFTGTTSKCKKIQLEVFTVTYELTGSELIALLKETQEIKINKPIYNRSQSKTILPWGLYAEKNSNGYDCLKLQKVDGRKKEITSYASAEEAKNAFFRISAQYKLCQKLNGLYASEAECFQYKIKECDGACIGKISIEDYNIRVQQFIDDFLFDNKSMMIIDRGRTVNERSAILIEEGIYKGFAFYDLNYQINTPAVLKNILVQMPHNRDTRNILQQALRKNKTIKVVPF